MPPKLRALNGIVKTALHVNDYNNPLHHINPKEHLTIDLLEHTITPAHNDSIKDHYTKVWNWFEERLAQLNIPKSAIEHATITITPDGTETCNIKTGNKHYTHTRNRT